MANLSTKLSTGYKFSKWLVFILIWVVRVTYHKTPLGYAEHHYIEWQ